MVRRKPDSSSEERRPKLVVSRQVADEKIRGQIDKGKDFLNRRIGSQEDLSNLRSDYRKWDDFNSEILDRIFENSYYTDEYNRTPSIQSIPLNPSFSEQADQLAKSIQRDISRLESICERLDLIPTVDSVGGKESARTESVLERILLRPKGKKSAIPGTKVRISLGSLPGTIDAVVSLPGQETPTVFKGLEIKDGAVELPMKLVFLCHAKEDAEKVKEIGQRLQTDGFLTWFDEDDLLPGDDWKKRIEEAIETSNYVLVFLSSVSVSKTGYVQREMKYALEQRELRPSGKRYIIPVLLEEVEPPREVKDIHWARLSELDWYQKLRKALNDDV